MEILCIKNSRFLIKGHWYKAINHLGDSYLIVNDTDIYWNTSWYHEQNFMTRQEVREDKLKKLRINE